MKLVKVLLSALFVVAIATGCPKKEEPKKEDPAAKKTGTEEAACTCKKADCKKCNPGTTPAPAE